MAELGGKEDTDRGTQLELVLVDVDCGEEPVQVVDREEEHLRVTLLVLTYLQHPLSHYLPHVRCYMSLYNGAVVILKIYLYHPMMDNFDANSLPTLISSPLSFSELQK